MKGCEAYLTRSKAGQEYNKKKIGGNNMSQKAKRHRRDNGLEETAQLSAPGEDAHALIQLHAYELYERRGGGTENELPGNDLDDWLQAEREVQSRLSASETMETKNE
jgi:hypothetical protein